MLYSIESSILVFIPFTLKNSRAVRKAKGEFPVSGSSRNVRVRGSLFPGPLKKIGLLRTKALTKLLLHVSWLSLSFWKLQLKLEAGGVNEADLDVDSPEQHHMHTVHLYT